MLAPQNVQARAMIEMDATGLHFRDLNARIHAAVAKGVKTIRLLHVRGQRYIGTGLRQPVSIEIHGVPGNDLAAFMEGPHITVYGNAQDGCGNTMNAGEIVIHGHAGDITGLSMRGGKIFIRDNVGYRVGIHMKEYREQRPAIVIGGTAQHFLGEYMAGGVLVLLGLNTPGGKHMARFIGTGMHGGVMYVRGTLERDQLGKEVGMVELNEDDHALLGRLIEEFCQHFNYDANEIMRGNFVKLLPLSKRPYGRLYAY
jgi:glutamate synthase domain-containing protein 3